MQVLFTPLAERHIDKLHEYITEHDGEDRADGYISRIVIYCNGFTTLPQAEPDATICCLACAL